MSASPETLSISAPTKHVVAAGNSWTRFVAAIPDHPLAAWRGPRVLDADWNGPIAHCQVTERGSVIRLHPDFFNLTEERQTLTLLHEAIHIDLMSGPWRDWYYQGGELDEAYTVIPGVQFGKGNDKILVDDGAWGDAIRLFTFPHEIAAEKRLQERYPQWGSRRAAYYLDMRKDDGSPDHLHPDLQPYARLFTLLRTELGCIISDGETREIAESLTADARRELQESKLPRLCDLVPTLLNVNAVPAHVDGEAYRAIFKETLASRPAPGTAP